MMRDVLGSEESVIHELRERLELHLPTVLDSIRADAGEDLALPDPAAVFDYVPTAAEIVQWPTVGIHDLGGSLEDDIGSSATNRFGLGIVIYCAAADLRELAWQLRRYRRAVATVALDGRYIGDRGWGVTLKRYVPGPTLSPDEGPRTWQSVTGVHIEVRTDDE